MVDPAIAPVWRYTVHDLVTGRLLSDVKPVSCPWMRVLNQVSDEQEAVFQWIGDDAAGVPWLTLFGPWSHVLVVSRNGKPVYAGVITKATDAFDAGTVTVTTQDVRVYFTKATTFGKNGYSGAAVGNNGILLKGYSPLAAAVALVYIGMMSTGGTPLLPISLPISFPAGYPANPGSTPDATYNLNPAPVPSGGAGSYTVPYHDFELEYIDSALTDTQELDDGPWIDFQPVLDAGMNLSWVMRAGDLLDASDYEWHMNGEQRLFNVTRTLDSDRLVNRFYATGAGSETGLLVATGTYDNGLPRLEGDDQWPTEKTLANLQKRATGRVNLYQQPVETWTASMMWDEVDQAGGVESMQLGSTHALYFKDHPRVSDGWHHMRLAKLDGDTGMVVHLTFEPINQG